MNTLLRALARHRLPAALAVPIALAVTLVLGSTAQASSFSYFQPYYNTAWCVNAEGILNGSQVDTVHCNSGNDTQWHAVALIGGYYQLVDIEGKCLEDHNNGGQGTVLDTWSCNDSTSQDWYPDTSGAGYPVYWIHYTGRCINLIANVGADVWTCNHTASQAENGPTPFS